MTKVTTMPPVGNSGDISQVQGGVTHNSIFPSCSEPGAPRIRVRERRRLFRPVSRIARETRRPWIEVEFPVGLRLIKLLPSGADNDRPGRRRCPNSPKIPPICYLGSFP